MIASNYVHHVSNPKKIIDETSTELVSYFAFIITIPTEKIFIWKPSFPGSEIYSLIRGFVLPQEGRKEIQPWNGFFILEEPLGMYHYHLSAGFKDNQTDVYVVFSDKKIRKGAKNN
jgi:hypothetical protein